jgi:hypothetical protein
MFFHCAFFLDYILIFGLFLTKITATINEVQEQQDRISMISPTFKTLKLSIEEKVPPNPNPNKFA